MIWGTFRRPLYQINYSPPVDIYNRDRIACRLSDLSTPLILTQSSFQAISSWPRGVVVRFARVTLVDVLRFRSSLHTAVLRSHLARFISPSATTPDTCGKGCGGTVFSFLIILVHFLRVP